MAGLLAHMAMNLLHTDVVKASPPEEGAEMNFPEGALRELGSERTSVRFIQ
jgi:hypothetical protein